MSYGAGDMEAYYRLIADRPELFRNAPAGGVDILTRPEEVRAAREEAAAFRRARGMIADDTRTGVLASDPYMMIIRDAVRFPNGSMGLYNRIIEYNPIAILPLLGERAVMIRVYRHGLRDWSWEFPRGGCDAGETPEQAAIREVGEEVGSPAVSIRPLGTFTPGGSSLSIRAHLFLAHVEGVGASDPLEGITDVVAMPIPEIERMVVDNVIIDGFSLALFTKARLAKLI